MKDAFCRIRGADVEHAVDFEKLDARAGAWIECAMRADATICRRRRYSVKGGCRTRCCHHKTEHQHLL